MPLLVLEEGLAELHLIYFRSSILPMTSNVVMIENSWICTHNLSALQVCRRIRSAQDWICMAEIFLERLRTQRLAALVSGRLGRFGHLSG